jgi:hypothetical protein
MTKPGSQERKGKMGRKTKIFQPLIKKDPIKTPLHLMKEIKKEVDRAIG